MKFLLCVDWHKNKLKGKNRLAEVICDTDNNEMNCLKDSWPKSTVVIRNVHDFVQCMLILVVVLQLG